MIDELNRLMARPGQRVKPRLRDFLSWVRRQRITVGPGLTMKTGTFGTVISARMSAPSFLGAFTVQIQGDRFSVAKGFVNGLEPKIEGTPISGTDKTPAPTVQVPKSFMEGRAWAFVEVKTGNGFINQEDPESVTIKAGPSLSSSDRSVGRCPIAVFEKKDDGVRIHQIVFFSLRHAYRNNRHFFSAA
jgi:hypothetical protein